MSRKAEFLEKAKQLQQLRIEEQVQDESLRVVKQLICDKERDLEWSKHNCAELQQRIKDIEQVNAQINVSPEPDPHTQTHLSYLASQLDATCENTKEHYTKATESITCILDIKERCEGIQESADWLKQLKNERDELLEIQGDLKECQANLEATKNKLADKNRELRGCERYSLKKWIVASCKASMNEAKFKKKLACLLVANSKLKNGNNMLFDEAEVAEPPHVVEPPVTEQPVAEQPVAELNLNDQSVAERSLMETTVVAESPAFMHNKKQAEIASEGSLPFDRNTSKSDAGDSIGPTIDLVASKQTSNSDSNLFDSLIDNENEMGEPEVNASLSIGNDAGITEFVRDANTSITNGVEMNDFMAEDTMAGKSADTLNLFGNSNAGDGLFNGSLNGSLNCSLNGANTQSTFGINIGDDGDMGNLMSGNTMDMMSGNTVDNAVAGKSNDDFDFFGSSNPSGDMMEGGDAIDGFDVLNFSNDDDGGLGEMLGSGNTANTGAGDEGFDVLNFDNEDAGGELNFDFDMF